MKEKMFYKQYKRFLLLLGIEEDEELKLVVLKLRGGPGTRGEEDWALGGVLS